ncbi:MAG: Type 1 glutamine amidotransferase-like domain-containing protein [Planctomycetia bacterium]|nr:Type 1 glutamine amidotransferase-like domain-containing protein [Planctomycetia bacterium]
MGLALVLWSAAVFAGSVAARADDDPFGLPAPHDKDRPGAVMLHGGGRRFSEKVRQEFVRLSGGQAARILLMPSDSYLLGKDKNGEPLSGGESAAVYERRMAREYSRWVALHESGEIADFQFLYRDPDGNPDDARLLGLLEKATGVWLPAHDQERLPAEFAAGYPAKTSAFQLALRDVVARGGVVGGLSGGMASLPETIIAGDADTEEGWVRAKLRFGLALFSGAIVDQNFNAHAGRLERLTDLLRNGQALDRLDDTPGVERRTIGLGVEQETVAILQRNTVRVIGEGHAHVFLKSNGDRTVTWHTLAAGEEPLVVASSSARRAGLPRPLPPADEQPEAAPNPFGMPEPADPSRPGIVVLHGGGETDEIIDLYPKLSGHPKPRLVHCPVARESCRPSSAKDVKQLARHLETTFREWRSLETDGRLARLDFVTTDNPADANRVSFVEPLKQAEALWFCGGSQRPLARLLVDRQKQTLFQQEAGNIVRRGGVVGGSSAGLAVMADVMIDGGEQERGAPAEASLSRGLGLLKHVLAEQHFDTRGGRIERLTGLLRDHERLLKFAPDCQPGRMIGLAVEEDTALIVQGNRLRVTGKKLAHVFVQSADPRSVIWHALKPGDAAIVREQRDGCVLELDDWEFQK